MRTKFILGLIVGILLCSLVSLEIPELAKLIDDTSNDFAILTSSTTVNSTVLSIQKSAPLPVFHMVSSLPSQENSPSMNLPHDAITLAGHTSNSADTLFRFLCIQRT
jgi:hypothetical protein